LQVTTTTKVPIVIPAAAKRNRVSSEKTGKRPLRWIALPGVLIGSILVITLASLFVVPLDSTGSHPQTLGQMISNLLTNNQQAQLDTQARGITPTPNATLNNGEGSCNGHDIWSTCATYIPDNGVMGTGHMQHPLNGAVITQVFGHIEYQQWCGCWKPHTGIDLAAPYGTPVMAADSGQVIWVGWDWSGLGWAVKINHGNYIATIYGHLDHYIVKVGQTVTKGQIIAYEGSTGASTGPHVHFMVLVHNAWVDPQLYVQLP
jgi:murein DD-endopeptidase MepM/ murein hydrolase activator NlpD